MVTTYFSEQPTESQEMLPEGAVSFDAFWEWSGDLRAEWVCGEVIVPMTPKPKHETVSRFLANVINGYARHHGLGTATMNLTMRFTARGRVPDVVFIRGLREADLPEEYLVGVADLAVEVVSYESRTRDRRTKRREYERAGLPEYWLADLIEGKPHFFQLEAGRYVEVLPDADGFYESRAVPGLRIPARWLIEPIADIVALEQLGVAFSAERYQRVEQAARDERQRAEREQVRADRQEAQAKRAQARARREQARAEQERARAERLAELLRAHGIDPEK